MSSEERRAYWRVRDMLDAIAKVRTLLDGRTFDIMYADDMIKAAFERFLEVISEASRHVPEQWKQEADPTIPWIDIKDLGNQLRHAYNKLYHRVLWDVYENDLDALEVALDRMIARHGDS